MNVPTRALVVRGHIFVFTIVIVWGILLHFIPTHTTWANYGFNLGYALLYGVGALVGLFGARFVTTEISMGKALLYLGLGLGANAIGLVVWAYFNLVSHIEIPYPSAADIFFLLFYLFMTIGCLHFLVMATGGVRRRYIAEAVGIFIVSGIIILGFINRPDLAGTLPALTKIFNVLYPLADSVLVALAYLTFRGSQGKFQFGVFLVIVGLLAQASADIIFTVRTDQNLYWNGDIADLLFAISGFILSFGIMTIFYDFLALEGPQEKSPSTDTLPV